MPLYDIDESAGQLLNALLPMFVTLLGMVMLESASQPLKHWLPIVSTPSEIVTEDKAEQSWNAPVLKPPPSIVVTVLGIVTDDREVQPQKQPPDSVVIPSCNVIAESAVHPLNALRPIVVTPLGKVIPERAVQFKKAPSPILVTPEGILTEVNEVQPLNALFPILVIVEGK